MARLKIGSVPYLNALPLIEGLEDKVSVDLTFASPVQLEVDLDRGVLDAALVPVITLFDRPHLSMFPFAGIACEDEAGSVLFFRRPGSELKRVAYDRGSRSSLTLLRVILAHEGLRPQWVPMDANLDKMLAAADGALLIGDAALAARGDPRLVFDLGGRWRKQTHMPFVFAVWAARTDHLRRSALGHLLTDASAQGLNKLVAISNRVAGRAGMSAMDILVYFTKNLRYRLGIIHLDALDQFRKLSAALPPMSEVLASEIPASPASSNPGAPRPVKIL